MNYYYEEIKRIYEIGEIHGLIPSNYKKYNAYGNSNYHLIFKNEKI